MSFFRFTRFRDKEGITLVWLALLLLPLLLIFAGLAVDIAYMYVAKNQLQVAADASALGGAALLDGANDLSQVNARTEAKTFASKNSAAGDPVQLADGGPGANTLSDQNDITVGHWDYASRTYTGGATPVNAVQVRPRRTGGSPGGPVTVFFGQILRYANMGRNWSLMSASAEAIATRPPRASTYIALCVEACTGCIDPDVCTLNPPRAINKDNCVPGECSSNAAWTSLLAQPTGPGFNLNELICTTTPYVDVCANPIFTTNGEDTVAQRNLEADMYDPSFDSENKEIVGGVVQSWRILVPITDTCPPGAQGGSWEPKSVYGYASVRVIAVCENGVGNPCVQFGGREYRAPSGVCDSYANNTILIDEISCLPCGSEQGGLKAVLVK